MRTLTKQIYIVSWYRRQTNEHGLVGIFEDLRDAEKKILDRLKMSSMANDYRIEPNRLHLRARKKKR